MRTEYLVRPLDEVSQMDDSVRFVQTISPRETYHRPREINFDGVQTKDSRRLLGMRGETTHCSEVKLWSLVNAITLDQGVVLTSGGYAAQESLADYGASFSNERFSIKGDKLILHQTPTDSDLTGLLLKKRGQTNYGHWLMELLIKHFVSLSCRSGPIIAPGVTTEFVRNMHNQTLSYFPKRTHYTAAYDPLIIASLEYITGISRYPDMKSPKIVELSNLFRNEIKPSLKNRKLFVTRGASHRRNVSNREEVETFFSQRGFEIIEPGSLQFAEQVRIFAEASEVVGIMGAAMCNTIFCDSSTLVGYISPTFMDGQWYIDQESAVSRGSFNFINCPNTGARTPVLFDDIEVDMELLRRWYDRILKSADYATAGAERDR